jgi:hypothetical protein
MERGQREAVRAGRLLDVVEDDEDRSPWMKERGVMVVVEQPGPGLHRETQGLQHDLGFDRWDTPAPQRGKH